MDRVRDDYQGSAAPRAVETFLPYIRGHLGRAKFRKLLKERIDDFLSPFVDIEKADKVLPKSDVLLQYGKIIVDNRLADTSVETLVRFCRLLILSMDSGKDTNFTTLFLSKDSITDANRVVTHIIGIIPSVISQMTGSRVSEVKNWQTLIHVMVVFSSANGWSYVRSSQQIQTILTNLCHKMSSPLYTEVNYTRLANSLFTACNSCRPLLSTEAINALFSIIFTPLRDDKVENGPLLLVFVCRVFTSPAIVWHLSKSCCEMLVQSKAFSRMLTLLRSEPNLIDEIEPLKSVNMMGNMIQLGYLDIETIRNRVVDWTWVICLSMAQCTQFAVRPGEKSSHNHWHPLFGHYKLPIDDKSQGALRIVSRQLQLLWSSRVVSALFNIALEGIELPSSTSRSMSHKDNDISLAFSKLWKRLGGSGAVTSSELEPISDKPPTLTSVVCRMYVSALSSMLHLKGDILSGLCHNDLVLRRLWAYLVQWGQLDGSSDVSPLDAALSIATRPSSPHAAPLQLFAEAAASVISILDEEEMYVKGVPFPINDLFNIARFCNAFCFRGIWNGLIASDHYEGTLFAAVHHLTIILYARDCRRQFTMDPKFWLSPDVKSSVMINEFEKKTTRGLLLMEKLSHCVQLRDRMLLFRKFIGDEKRKIDDTAALITVTRTRIVEDGYRQLSLLEPRALKNTIRVKFINQQGLEEAGIDQDGVFKEFLELTMKEVFTPALNLFTSTSSGVLYPSSTSYVHDNHLQLFQFIGRMLGKAVYEGIVVDVQLAPVLLAAVLGGRRLCAFDELAQLDPELYKNLTFVKRYTGDLSDLGLTFSTDDDRLGQVVTTDLITGGRSIHVTNENRIDYVHRMAHHRVFAQTRDQCKAFVSGLQSILHSQWLSLFAPHELQYLISGQTCDIDIADLKKHVQYYGGFHGSHRLIKWLWSIIESEFDADERRLFLKFVTSCSKPPLLGFSYLEPPFSIRCVEVSDDQDQGDTLGSVVRGFLTLRKSHSVTRLPTASTCFNLLKLPNYNKKSILLAKLRYAIHAESGFELS